MITRAGQPARRTAVLRFISDALTLEFMLVVVAVLAASAIVALVALVH
jgi:hypothetical protein